MFQCHLPPSVNSEPRSIYLISGCTQIVQPTNKRISLGKGPASSGFRCSLGAAGPGLSGVPEHGLDERWGHWLHVLMCSLLHRNLTVGRDMVHGPGLRTDQISLQGLYESYQSPIPFPLMPPLQW